MDWHTHINEDSTTQHGRPVKVELLVRCENLADLDVISKTDPMCVLFGRQFGQWRELGRTEAVDNSLNPRFTESFILDYNADLPMPLRFSVYDIDTKSTDLSKHDHVGSVETSLERLVQPDVKVSQTLYTLRVPGDPRSRGELIVMTELVGQARGRLYLHLGGQDLHKTGVLKLSKPSCCLEVCRGIPGGHFHPIFRTEVVPKSVHPRWRPFELSIQRLCNGDPDRHIQFICWRIEENYEEHLRGAVITTLREITNHRPLNVVPLLKHKKNKTKKAEVKGFLKFLQSRVDMSYSMVDYIRGGCCLRLIIAVDFTSSNGDPSSPASLHHLGNEYNEYEKAIQNVGALLAHYNLHQQIASFGFGAKKSATAKTKHCFSLSGLRNDPYCKGISGVLEKYRETVGRVVLSGPSRLAPVLKEATRMASCERLSQDNQKYWVLMIVTDGVVNDVDDTLEAIKASLDAPLSVVIVGIGPADFSSVEEMLHSANQLLVEAGTSKSKECNWQFVTLRRKNYSTGVNDNASREALAAVSSQLVSFMSEQLIAPAPPVLHCSDPLAGGSWVGGLEAELRPRDWSVDSGDGPHMSNTLRSTSTSPGTITNTLQSTGLGTARISSSVAGPQCPTCGSQLALNYSR